MLEATRIAEHAAHLAHMRGAKPIVLPTIPFGNNAQQLDQVATIHFSTATADAILNDVCSSLSRQGIDRLVILNAHGGNEFKPLVRDAQLNHEMLIVLVNFFQLERETHAATFENPGDHADEMETSLLLHLSPHLVVMEQASDGQRIPFDIKEISGDGVWTPRPWSTVHPDTGCGDPTAATADKGRIFFEAVTKRIADLFCDLSKAKKGQTPYL